MTTPHSKRWFDWRWAIAFVLYVGLLVVISILAYQRQLPSSLTANDKLGHFILFGFSGFLSHQMLRQRWLRFSPAFSLPLGPFIISILVIVDELLQSLSPNRSAGVDDLWANWLGIVAFVAVGDWILARLNRSHAGSEENAPPETRSPSLQRPLQSPTTLIQRLYKKMVQVLYRRVVLVLAVLMMGGAIAAIANMSDLSNSLIQSQALQYSQMYARALMEARTLYSDQVVERLDSIHGISLKEKTTYTPQDIPLPVTFLIELNHRLEDGDDHRVRLYSDYPFPWRQKEGGPKDQFEEDAWTYLNLNPTEIFTRLENYQGRLSLRYAQADVMKPSCLGCHNSRPDSPRQNWQAGDVRGVLEVITPLDGFTAKTQGRLKSTFLTMLLLSALGLSGLVLVMGRLRQYSHDLEQQVSERTAELQTSNEALASEKEKSERLLLNILPEPIAARLKESSSSIADGFPEATILFADIVGFTQLSETLPPDKLVALLNRIFSEFDQLTDRYDLEKIKTIGDSYMVAGGLPSPRSDHTEAIANLALDMQTTLATIGRNESIQLSMRIGIHTGPVVAGVIGTKKFIYDLWGDTVNLASRMESHGIPGEIQVSKAVYDRLQDSHILEERGTIDVKGKGPLTAYILRDRQPTFIS